MNGNRWVFCGLCPEAYPSSRIDVLLDGEWQMTLDRLDAEARDGLAGSSIVKTFFRGRRSKKESHKLDVDRLQPYSFQCPEGHPVDGNRGEHLPVAVVGGSGASKSHFLPAIVREVAEQGVLRKSGVTLAPGLYTDTKITDDAKVIFRAGKALEHTPTTGVLGPYGYRLRVAGEPRDPNPDEYSLQLFDVAGENLADIMSVARNARFVLRSEAIVVLIDPEKFLPSRFDDAATATPQRRVDAAIDAAEGVRIMIDGLSEAWRTSAVNLKVPFCFVVAKADAVEWPAGFDWAAQTTEVLRAGMDRDALHACLLRSSDAVRAALCQLGGDHVVDQVEEALDPAWVRFAAASATSAMPVVGASRNGGSAWMAPPAPQGVGLVLLQILDMAGRLAVPHRPAPPVQE